MSIKYTHLGHPAMLCNRYDETLDFYTNKLGCIKLFDLYHDDGSLWLTYIKIARGQFVELFANKYAYDENKQKERSFEHFCIEVDDLPASIRFLKSNGVEVYWGPVDMGVKAEEPYEAHLPGKCGSLCAFIRDPEGNDIELMQFTENSLQLK